MATLESIKAAALRFETRVPELAAMDACITWTKSGDSEEAIGVEDRCGKTYRKFLRAYRDGEVVKGVMELGEGGNYEMHFRILRAVKLKEVRAVAKRFIFTVGPITAGHWYEVLSD